MMKKIMDKNSHRGFYYKDIKTGDWYEDDGTNKKHVKEVTLKYSRGFHLTHGRNTIEHLFRKLQEGLTLNKNERMEFDEKVGPINVHKQMNGIWYDFRQVLVKVPVINAWLISYSEISKADREAIENRYEGTVCYEELYELFEAKGDENEH